MKLTLIAGGLITGAIILAGLAYRGHGHCKPYAISGAYAVQTADGKIVTVPLGTEKGCRR